MSESEVKAINKRIDDFGVKLDETLDKTNSTINNLENKVDRLLFYVESDPATKRKGLFEQVQENETLTFKNRTQIKDIKFKAGVLGVVAGAAFTFVKWIVSILF